MSRRLAQLLLLATLLLALPVAAAADGNATVSVDSVTVGGAATSRQGNTFFSNAATANVVGTAIPGSGHTLSATERWDGGAWVQIDAGHLGTFDAPVSTAPGRNDVRLRAVDDEGAGAETSLAIYVDDVAPAPAAPYQSPLAWDKTTTLITLRWYLPEDGAPGMITGDRFLDATQYRAGDVSVRLQRYNAGTSTWQALTGWGTATQAADSGLTTNTCYQYRLQARDNSAEADGPWHNEANSDPITLCTLPTYPDVARDPLSDPDGHFSFTNNRIFGPGTVDHYHYHWDANASGSATSTDSVWDSSTSVLNLTATSEGYWYLHLISHNATHNQGTGAINVICESGVQISGAWAGTGGYHAVGETVHLTAGVTAGSSVSYAWDWRDGSTGSGPTVEHVYTAPGSYDVKVVISNPLTKPGYEWINTRYVSAVVQEPLTGLAAAAGGPVVTGTAATLTATVTAGSSLTYTWDFGDGSAGDGAGVQHTYAAAGVYEAEVTAANNVSGPASATATVVVQDAVGDLAANSSGPAAPGAPVTFTATAQGTQVTYEWAFGDGGHATGASVSHAYASPGTYTATVTASNAVSSDSAQTSVRVGIPAPPSAVVEAHGVPSDTWLATTADPTFIWSGATPAGSAIAGYDVYWGTDPAGNSGTAVTGSSFTGSVPASGTYYLRVRTRDAAGRTSEWVTLFCLRLDRDAPGPPGTAVEAHGVVSGEAQDAVADPAFTWAGASDGHSGVAGYHVYWGSDPQGESETLVPTAAYDPPAPDAAGVRYLRARAVDAAGNTGTWVTLFTFRYSATGDAGHVYVPLSVMRLGVR